MLASSVVCVAWSASVSVANKSRRAGRAAVLQVGGGVGEDVVAGGQSAGDRKRGERQAREVGGLDAALGVAREGERGAGVEGGA